LSYLADVCRSQSRKSDVVGYVGNARFAILAPDTDGDGARQFIGRLQKAIERDAGQVHTDVPESLHAGFCAVRDFGTFGTDPVDVVRRASSALEHAEGAGTWGRATSFDELPVT
jgi:GGDEF domain-containing protein